MIIKIVCSCGKERKPIIYVSDGDEVVALLESGCPYCSKIYIDEIDKLNEDLKKALNREEHNGN